MVKELRTITGAGVLDCRNALLAAAGDFEKAAEILRRQGMAEAEERKEREANEGLIAAYIHTGDRLGAMVELNCETDFVAHTNEFRNLAKELTMQVAASNPLYVCRADIPGEVIARQEEAYRAEMGAENKPPHIVERIISGKMEKFYKESCLLEQPYIRDPDITVGELIDRLNATLGENIVVRRFVRYELGK
ncbi:MAG: translation elongation factor Ts [Anaerolineae bacterium]|nr:translation elongation factor Ts [Anaerolineae bacterium]